MKVFHTPVLLEECLTFLACDKADGLMVDGTLGEGGHTEAFLKKFPSLTVYGVDADSAIQAVAKERLAEFKNRVRFFNCWSDVFFKTYSFEKKPDVILLDLGISSFHYQASMRGFSFSSEEPLDMRLDTGYRISASDLVNGMGERELADIIFKYGEERYSRRIAQAIIAARKNGRIETAKQLADIIFNAVPAQYRYGHLHPATRTFQALRIAVNGELDRLPSLLESAFKCLAAGGRLGVITFHSLEDRIVKRYFKSLSTPSTEDENMPKQKVGRAVGILLTKKAIMPTDAEVRQNAPSRSAKLRVIEKTA